MLSAVSLNLSRSCSHMLWVSASAHFENLLLIVLFILSMESDTEARAEVIELDTDVQAEMYF